MTTTHKVEIVVHVDDLLGKDQQTELIDDLKRNTGVEDAHFTPGHAHLLIVDYDPDEMSVHDVLDKVRKENRRAELIGPM